MTSQLANVVVFTPGDFQRLVHTLSEQHNFVAVGSIQRLPGSRRTEFLVRAVRCLPFSALASERRQHPTRIEIGLAATSARAGAACFLPYVRDSFAPGDCVIKLALAPAPQPDIASGVVLSQSARAPVHAVRVGANTISTPDGEAPQSSQRDRERWSRLIGALGARAWEQIRRWDVCLVGVGRNGSLVAHALVRLGIHRLTLIDPDAIELHNLDAMDVVVEGDVGKPKVVAVAAHLQAVNSGVLLHPLPVSACTEAAVLAMQEADLLVSCVDDNAARLFVNTVATGCLKPHLDIGTGVFSEHASRVIGADIRLILPGDGCLLCIGGAGDVRANLARLVAAQAGLELPRSPWNQQRLGSLRSVNQMAVSEGMRLLEMLAEGGIEGSCWIRIEWDGVIPQIRLVSHESDPLCGLHAFSGCDDRLLSLSSSQDKR